MRAKLATNQGRENRMSLVVVVVLVITSRPSEETKGVKESREGEHQEGAGTSGGDAINPSLVE